MALTAALVSVTPNKLTYLITNAATLGTSATIPAAGGATPDLATDCVNAAAGGGVTGGRAACARLRKVCRAGLDGLGAQAAGGWTAAEAADLLFGNSATPAGTALMPRAQVTLVPLTGVAGGPLVEATANVDGSGRPQIDLTAVAAAGTCLLIVELQSSPGVK